MILDVLDRSGRYKSIHPGFGAAFDLLRRSDLADWKTGKHSLDGERLLVIFGKEPPKAGEAKLESHRRYIDVQYVIAGADRIGWRPIESLTVDQPYDPERDVAFYANPCATWLHVAAGSFAIFFPEDGHAPLAGSVAPHKAVVKVAVDW